ncbi:MAG: hypothetical protein Q4G30_07870 [Actinomycetaceae bacterium]|nr:hypothetical protein [Actinomycetaceae bacterium]
METDYEALAAHYENGVPLDELEKATWKAGQYAWLVDMFPNWDEIEEKARQENLTPAALITKAVEQYEPA